MALLRIAGIPVPGPADLLDGARAVAGWTGDAAEVAAELPARTIALLDDVTGLVGRIGTLAGRAEGLIDRMESMMDRADGLIEHVAGTAAEARTLVAGVGETVAEADRLITRVGRTTTDAERVVLLAAGVSGEAQAVVADAGGLSSRAGAMLATYEPITEKAAPLAARFVEEFSHEELQAAIRLVDQLPQLVEHLEEDVMPILVTLDRVGPDVHDLLDELKGVRQAINGIPGFGFFRRRGEDKDTDTDT